MSQPYEEVTFREFVLFVKVYHKQLKENSSIYLNLELSVSELDRVKIVILLDSFIALMHQTDIDTLQKEYKEYLEIWLQSQLAVMDHKTLHLFQLVFEKALFCLMVQQKNKHLNMMMSFMFMIFTYLVQIYEKYEEIPQKTFSQDMQRLDQLNQLLIRSSGHKDLAYILKECEAYFHYKRCVFYAYIPWSNHFYGVVGAELSKVQSMKGELTSRSFILNSRQPVYLKNPKNYIKEEHIILFNLSSVIFIPVVYEDQLFGWLTFDQMGEVFDYAKDELLVLEQVGQRIGLFLARKDESTEEKSTLHLTERESMILNLLAEGYDNKKIGSLLFLSEHTVRDYISSLMTKLRAKNRTQVVAAAFRLGLLS
ncbi:LuxR C-terminal-related transcriptional regulator [Lysinibacillus piscis]|uniref:HTH luxR-type domain-containing protein n=1 Tax=Lysinibacillus piscis TaxID=2518931 RepID=A0ABQ5NI47_9BACI|nr:LuxR C-terminal-related transcriptional regulator [Lysinibacillus sp. KH24]GLC88031.1 hypothetical protein LYSBPC_11580 [Lysinibacillus sp. KH24]